MAGERVDGAGECNAGRSIGPLSSSKARWESPSSTIRLSPGFNGGGSLTKCLVESQFHDVGKGP